MQSHELLKAVGEMYSRLQSLEAELLEITENHVEGCRQRTERRVVVYYAAPNRVRIEEAGRPGSITVSDGVHVHHCLRWPKEYSKSVLAEPWRLPGRLRPEYPISGGAGIFLYDRIHERVVEAKILRDDALTLSGIETPCQVVSVAYELPPRARLLLSTSPVLFWIDSRTRTVLRHQRELTMTLPPENEPRTEKHTTLVTRWSADRPISPARFEFVPPPEAMDVSNPSGCGGFSSGDMFIEGEAAGKKSISHWDHRHWDGEAYVEQSRWTFRGHEITFERRWQLSDDGKEVCVSERIVGPKGEQKRTVSIPVSS